MPSTVSRRPRVRSAALSLLLLAACSAGTSGSEAADVPSTDVRQLPEERKARVADVMMVAADKGRVLGSDTAAVRLLIVSDYQCAECRALFDSTLPALRIRYVETGRARITWVHYPLKTHPNAVRAAGAALCASAQGRFWEASAALFAAQDAWGPASAPEAMIDSLVSVPGIDRYALRNCTASGRMLRQVRADIDWSDTVRAGKPPTIVIGTRPLAGVPSLPRISAALDSALARR